MSDEKTLFDKAADITKIVVLAGILAAVAGDWYVNHHRLGVLEEKAKLDGKLAQKNSNHLTKIQTLIEIVHKEDLK